MNKLLHPIEYELQQVQQLINKSFKIKAGHLSTFAHLNFEELNSVIRPALLLLCARLYGNINVQTITLAAVVQFIFMASNVHSGINEDSNDSQPLPKETDPRDGCQFPVLVGDYLYGRFFTSLCDANIVNYLHPLSKIICKINEGGILRLKQNSKEEITGNVLENIILNETAELFAGSCRLGGALVGAGEMQQKFLHHTGISLGMAFGLMEYNAPSEQINKYLAKAQENIQYLPNIHARKNMEQLVSLFPYEADDNSHRMVG